MAETKLTRALVAGHRASAGLRAILIAVILPVLLPAIAFGQTRPEPAGWFAGDMHAHRSCGGAPVPVASIRDAMIAQDLAVVSLLADMGNGEVQDPATDLPRVNGLDDPISTPDRIIHWDAEWHWDATYTQFPHQALGGHLVNLGLTDAHQIWNESTFPILAWAHQQRGIAGFAHMQYLDGGFPQNLSCCTPVEYPVEVALGASDFISEDVSGSETAIDAYYRLLNCGFRPGLASGTDYPCGQEIGPMLTYAQVAGGTLNYRGWIEAIARGRTVVSRTGHTQFLSLRVDGSATPGDEIRLTSGGDVQVAVQWTANQSLSRTIEIVRNGVVVASKSATAAPGAPDELTATLSFPASGWLCARVMGAGGHEVHTAAVFVTVANAPVRASAGDANDYVQWMDDLLDNTSAGGAWNSYFPTGLAEAQARYQAARSIYQQIAAGADVAPMVVSQAPGSGATDVPIGSNVVALFNEVLNAATVSATTFTLEDASHNPVAAAVTYDAGLRTATLTPSGPLAASATYTASLKGGSGGIADPAGTPLAADVSWSFTTAAPDMTPPTVVSTLPAAGASGVPPSATVNATLSEALNPATVTTVTFELKDAASTPVAAAASYNNLTHTATLTPAAALASGLYTATLKGGGIQDLSGNPLTADYTWSFTVAGYTCPCTIWSPSTVPATISDPDASANELGVKFRAVIDGYAVGVRFYKGTTNTGTHVGNLWSAAGALLATATFTGETASGWQEVSFSAPVAITANSTYIASYHTGSGHYSGDEYYFASGVDAGPLRALANGEDGPNGVYHAGAVSGFPSSDYHASNYWVDVVFTTSVGPDVTAPTVVSRVPASGATAVAVGTSVIATFSEAVDPATVDGTTFELRDATNALVPAAVSYSVSARTATLAPTSALAYSATYTATLKGGVADPRIKDLAGNALEADVTWSFNTSAPPPPPPDEGPGGPILVIGSAANPFTRYYAEILRAEGLNEFTVTDISNVTRAVLDAHDIAILGDMSLGSAEVTLLTDWVTAGGHLIAMRPDKQLASLLGLTDAFATLGDQYLRVDASRSPGRGITAETMQFHGTADLYALNGATAIATLYSDATTPTTHPAATLRSVGTQGGQVAAFAFDLARSVVYTRQGNPAWAGLERDLDAVNVIRSDDMFFGPPTTPPSAPEWVDRDKLHIPQADEQQRLFANLILQMNTDKKPLPRFWYLPKGLKAAIMMRGDDHGSGNTATRFDQYVAQSPSPCSLDDWECVRTTSFLSLGAGFNDEQAQHYTSLGFEVGLHLDSNIPSSCSNYFTDQQIEDFYGPELASFNATFPSLGPTPITNIHCGTWSMWVGLAKAELRHGNRLDGDYYYWVGWPPNWLESRPGVFTGSAIPMRFADLDGTMIDVYQVPTQMTDESGQSYPMTVDSLLDRVFDARGYYGIYHANMHTDNATEPSSDVIVQHAQARGVPIISCRQVLTWLDGRNNSSFQSIAWNGSVLEFDISAAAGSRNMEAMLPALIATASLKQVSRDGAPLTIRTETIKGVAYGFIPATSGHYAATYEADTSPPVISAVVATPHMDGSATITWTTDEASDSRVDYGTDPDALDHNTSDATSVTSHGLMLAGLAGNTTYYYRVTSADAFANSATSPAAPAPPASFATPPPPCFVDQTSADFALGTVASGIAIAGIGDGEVILSPALLQDFNDTALPADWVRIDWNQGGAGTVTFGGGVVVVDGARLNPASLTGYGPGTSVEFVATFEPATFQGAGFGAGDNSISGLFNITPVALFGTGTGTTVKARTIPAGGSEVSTELPTALIGSPHRYRVDWLADRVDYYVDGALVASHAVAIGGTMRPGISDYSTGGPAFTADWLRVGPYAASGTFTSRIFDAGNPATWGSAFWTAEVPSGSSLALSVRTGDTPVPDGSWTAYAALPSSGSPIGAVARYIQYRAELASASNLVTPALADFTATCNVTPDATPPVISGVAAATAGNGTSETIDWTTDELADSRVDYGTSADALTLSVSATARVTSHSLTLTGLAINTTYYYRVRSEDGSHNATVFPAPPQPPLHFNTPVSTIGECFADRTTADFTQGTTGGTSYVSETADGEVILAPATGAEFSGASLPPDWVPQQWQPPNGSLTVSGGQLTLSGYALTPSGYYGPYGTLEAVATFQGETFEHVGLENFAAPGSPYAIFSTNNSTNQLWARIPGNDTPIPGGEAYIGSPHLYRLVWQASGFEFWIDGVLKATLSASSSTALRPFMSDYNPSTVNLSVDWMRLSPYAASGSYRSRVYDAGAVSDWTAASWTSDTPSGTSLAMSVRTGDTPIPDETWSAFTTLPTPGYGVGRSSRYVQYRADLGTAVQGVTPILRDVVFECRVGPDMDPPAITNVTATPDASGRSATITWTTDEIADSRVAYGVTPDALTLNVANSALLMPHSIVLTGLTPSVTYYYRVTSTDAAANSATAPAPPAPPLSFTTPVPVCALDRTGADFRLGDTSGGTYVAETVDGAVTLEPTVGIEFSGVALPGDWMNAPWNEGNPGSVGVGSGAMAVDGQRVNPASTIGYGPGRTIEFVATFQPANHQGVGLGVGDNTTGDTGLLNTFPFAGFGTGNGTDVRARSGTSSSDIIEPVIAGLTGTPHRYRIDWLADRFDFYVDGAPVASNPTVIVSPMRPAISDYLAGGPALQVDWLRLTPYAASGSFVSRVHDSGEPSSWGSMSWSADVPSGTSLAMSARTGNTPSPDGSWSAWAPVPTSGSPVGGIGRYIQYSAALTANAALDQTPSLEDVGINCTGCDAAAPVVIADLATSGIGNAGGGRVNVRVSWSGVAQGGVVAVYRKAYGDYPLYRSDHGSAPTAPASPAAAISEGWVLTGVTAAAGLDAPPTRGFWYYVAFVTNACGLMSGPSNVSTGTLDYVLGDVSNGAAVCADGGEAGDAIVNTPDLSALGDSYGQSFGPTDDRVCFDVGPTVDFGTRSRPVPDGVLDFDDLAVYALNFDVPLASTASAPRAANALSPRAKTGAAAAVDELSLIAPPAVKSGEPFDVVLRCAGSGRIHALSTKLSWDASLAQVIGYDAGALLVAAGGMVLSPRPGTLDAAVLGANAPGLTGQGDVAVIHFRALADGDPQVRLAGTRARGGDNRPVTLGVTGAPVTPAPLATGIGFVFPNPFRGSLNVSFSLARDTRVKLVVYDLAGRAVRHLENGARPAGTHVVLWDGRADAGHPAAAGLYVVRFEAGEVQQTRRVQLIR